MSMNVIHLQYAPQKGYRLHVSFGITVVAVLVKISSIATVLRMSGLLRQSHLYECFMGQSPMGWLSQGVYYCNSSSQPTEEEPSNLRFPTVSNEVIMQLASN